MDATGGAVHRENLRNPDEDRRGDRLRPPAGPPGRRRARKVKRQQVPSCAEQMGEAGKAERNGGRGRGGYARGG